MSTNKKQDEKTTQMQTYPTISTFKEEGGEREREGLLRDQHAKP